MQCGVLSRDDRCSERVDLKLTTFYICLSICVSFCYLAHCRPPEWTYRADIFAYTVSVSCANELKLGQNNTVLLGNPICDN